MDLKRGLRDLTVAEDSRVLLGRLRARRDLFAAMAEEIDELLRGAAPMTQVAQEETAVVQEKMSLLLWPGQYPIPPARIESLRVPARRH